MPHFSDIYFVLGKQSFSFQFWATLWWCEYFFFARHFMQTSVSGWCCIPPQLFSSVTLRCEVTVMGRRLCSVPRSERDEELLRPTDTFLTSRRRVYLQRFFKTQQFLIRAFLSTTEFCWRNGRHHSQYPRPKTLESPQLSLISTLPLCLWTLLPWWRHVTASCRSVRDSAGPARLSGRLSSLLPCN